MESTNKLSPDQLRDYSTLLSCMKYAHKRCVELGVSIKWGVSDAVSMSALKAMEHDSDKASQAYFDNITRLMRCAYCIAYTLASATDVTFKIFEVTDRKSSLHGKFVVKVTRNSSESDAVPRMTKHSYIEAVKAVVVSLLELYEKAP